MLRSTPMEVVVSATSKKSAGIIFHHVGQKKLLADMDNMADSIDSDRMQ
jgi:hypothetical protein